MLSVTARYVIGIVSNSKEIVYCLNTARHHHHHQQQVATCMLFAHLCWSCIVTARYEPWNNLLFRSTTVYLMFHLCLSVCLSVSLFHTAAMHTSRKTERPHPLRVFLAPGYNYKMVGNDRNVWRFVLHSTRVSALLLPAASSRAFYPGTCDLACVSGVSCWQLRRTLDVEEPAMLSLDIEPIYIHFFIHSFICIRPTVHITIKSDEVKIKFKK